MKTTVELYTRMYNAELSVIAEGVQITLDAEEKDNLEEYLAVVLPNYVQLTSDNLSLEQLLQHASKWQAENPDQRLSEPVTKLPYDVEIEVKSMLEELSQKTGTSQAQLLTKIVNKAYQEKVKGNT